MTVSTFADPAGVHNPAPAGVAPATWFTQLNTNFLAMRNRPSAMIRASASQSLSASSTVQITLGTVVADNSSLMTGTANALTIPTNYGGLWMVGAQLSVQTTGTSVHTLTFTIRKNAATLYYDFVERGAAAGGSADGGMSAAFMAQLVATDVLTLYITTSTFVTGGTTTTASSPTSVECHLSAFWISA